MKSVILGSTVAGWGSGELMSGWAWPLPCRGWSLSPLCTPPTAACHPDLGKTWKLRCRFSPWGLWWPGGLCCPWKRVQDCLSGTERSVWKSRCFGNLGWLPGRKEMQRHIQVSAWETLLIHSGYVYGMGKDKINLCKWHSVMNISISIGNGRRLGEHSSVWACAGTSSPETRQVCVPWCGFVPQESGHFGKLFSPLILKLKLS